LGRPARYREAIAVCCSRVLLLIAAIQRPGRPHGHTRTPPGESSPSSGWPTRTDRCAIGGAARKVTPGERRPSTRGRTRPYREAIGGSRNQESHSLKAWECQNNRGMPRAPVIETPPRKPGILAKGVTGATTGGKVSPLSGTSACTESTSLNQGVALLGVATSQEGDDMSDLGEDARFWQRFAMLAGRRYQSF
jgi:hypothetical protein